MVEAKTRDGRTLRAPMASVSTYAKRFTDLELKALWAYLQST